MFSFAKIRLRSNSKSKQPLQTPSTKLPIDGKKSIKKSSSKNHDELKTATSPSTHRCWTRTVVIFAVMTLAYFYTENQRSGETKFALQRENIPLRMQKFQCSPSYEHEMQKFPECVPQKCGRFVSDQLVENVEVEVLLDLAKGLIARAVSKGGASVLDLHSGALTYGDRFLNIYTNPKLVALIRKQHLSVFKHVKSKIKLIIARQFGIPPDSLFLTHPTFFSRFTNESAKTLHDEYWHEHVDKETYPSFHYTSLLYLNNFGEDFEGGRFIFVDGAAENKTTSSIEPKKARLSAFTSGEDNRHYVEKVTGGERYAITISFSCDKDFAITDPQIK